MAFHDRIPGNCRRMNSRAVDVPCFFPEYVLRPPSGLRKFVHRLAFRGKGTLEAQQKARMGVGAVPLHILPQYEMLVAYGLHTHPK